MKPLRFLLSLLIPFLGMVFLSVFLGAATIVANISLMGTSAYLIAYAALHPSIAYLQVAIVGVRFFGLARGAFRYLERLVSHSLNFKLLTRLRIWLFGKLEAIAPAGLLDVAGGDILARLIEDIETLDNFYIRALSPPLVALVVVGSTSLFLGGFSPVLGWTLLTGLVISGLGMPLLVYAFNRSLGRRVVQLKSEMSAQMVEVMQGLGDLSIYGQNEDVLHRVKDISTRLSRAQLWQISVSSAGSSINLLITNLTLCGMLVIAIMLVNQQLLDGVLLAVIALITLASFEAVTPLVQAAQNLENSMTSARRIIEIAEKELLASSGVDPVNFAVNSISVEGLDFKYNLNDDWVLRDIDFRLRKGKKIALVGPSGAGKSSLAALLLRFYSCSRGRILLDDRDTSSLPADEIRKKITLVSQNVYIFNDTLRNNLLLAREETGDEELKYILNQVQLGEWYSKLPEGLDTWLGEQGAFISGGERQRLALARTLLQHAEFIVLDEPFANLDGVTSEILLQVYTHALAGKGLLWITHQLIGMEDMDEIMVLEGGGITERGNHSTLLQNGGWYARMWKLQKQII